MNAPVRNFEAKTAVRGHEPLSIGIAGPPGGGKTVSSMRLAKGIQEVNGGDIVLIDTECRRALKYAPQFKFLHVEFDPPHRSDYFLAAIEQQLARKPACIIVDSMSDEHEGIGGYLDLRDEGAKKMSGNSWAGTAEPAKYRKMLKRGLIQIKVPLIFTFRAREKTKQEGKSIVNLGWMPIAPLEIVHNLDLTCILPPRADGVPVWESRMIGEDFIIKLPNFLQHCITTGALDENTGRALAVWARGGASPVVAQTIPSAPVTKPAPASQPEGIPPSVGAGEVSMTDLDDALAKAAAKGTKALIAEWKKLTPDQQVTLEAAKDRRHKPAAAAADAALTPAVLHSEEP